MNVTHSERLSLEQTTLFTHFKRAIRLFYDHTHKISILPSKLLNALYDLVNDCECRIYLPLQEVANTI